MNWNPQNTRRITLRMTSGQLEIGYCPPNKQEFYVQSIRDRHWFTMDSGDGLVIHVNGACVETFYFAETSP